MTIPTENAEAVEFNGLTDSETAATASVMGLLASDETKAALARMDECRSGCDAGDPFYADVRAWDRLRPIIAGHVAALASSAEPVDVAMILHIATLIKEDIADGSGLNAAALRGIVYRLEKAVSNRQNWDSAYEAAIATFPGSPSDRLAFMAGVAYITRNPEKHAPPAVPDRRPCNMGVGCEEMGVCYASANGHPERCGKSDAHAELLYAIDLIDDFTARCEGSDRGSDYVINGIRDYINKAFAPTAPEEFP